MIAPKKSNTMAVIIWYEPSDCVYENIDRILMEFERIAVISNGPCDADKIKFAKVNNIDFIQNEINLGIAAALNQGLKLAFASSIEWVVFFDQDSQPTTTNFIDNLSTVLMEHATPEKIAVIGVNYHGAYNKSVFDHPEKWRNVKTVITSGSLVNVALSNKLGQFREDYFIDHVDHEFCLRARKMNLYVLLANFVRIKHMIGNPLIVNIFSWKITNSRHSAVRRYYSYRNLILLTRDYLMFDPNFCKRELYINFKIIFKILLFENDKFLKIKYVCKGLYDGLMGVSGPIKFKSKQ